MNFVHFKNYTIFLSLAALAIGCIPGTIISEPRVPKKFTTTSPITILYSGITKYDTSNALLLKVNTKNTDEIISVCSDQRILIEQGEDFSTLQWKPGKDCKIPLVTYKGKNYILPLSQTEIPLDTLADISTETLKNTLAITTLLNTDVKLSTLKTRKIIRNIGSVLEARNTRFIMPISGAKLPEKDSHLPNSSRPFRADVTDGIHHGWDFYVNQGTTVLAVEEGRIVHIKRDFSWSEMNHLHDAGSELGLQENLDIYRGNTVYLKTLSGHVAIYAHMANIPTTLKVGDYVAADTIVGQVGDSAVPDKKYLYHLHFELAMNPFTDEKAGTYVFEDYLVWPWFGKGKTTAWVRDNDKNLFQ